MDNPHGLLDELSGEQRELHIAYYVLGRSEISALGRAILMRPQRVGAVTHVNACSNELGTEEMEALVHCIVSPILAVSGALQRGFTWHRQLRDAVAGRGAAPAEPLDEAPQLPEDLGVKVLELDNNAIGTDGWRALAGCMLGLRQVLLTEGDGVRAAMLGVAPRLDGTTNSSGGDIMTSDDFNKAAVPQELNWYRTREGNDSTATCEPDEFLRRIVLNGAPLLEWFSSILVPPPSLVSEAEAHLKELWEHPAADEADEKANKPRSVNEILLIDCVRVSLSTLQHIQLNEGNIMDEGANILWTLAPYLPQLRKLHLVTNQLCLGSVQPLVKAMATRARGAIVSAVTQLNLANLNNSIKRPPPGRGVLALRHSGISDVSDYYRWLQSTKAGTARYKSSLWGRNGGRVTASEQSVYQCYGPSTFGQYGHDSSNACGHPVTDPLLQSSEAGYLSSPRTRPSDNDQVGPVPEPGALTLTQLPIDVRRAICAAIASHRDPAPRIAEVNNALKICSPVASSGGSPTEPNSSSDQGSAFLVPHPALPSAHIVDYAALTVLNLDYNNIGDGGALALCPALAVCCPSLLRLGLSDNGIGDLGALAIARYLIGDSRCRIEFLNLSVNQISDAGFIAIANALSIRRRVPRRALVTEHGVASASSDDTKPAWTPVESMAEYAFLHDVTQNDQDPSSTSNTIELPPGLDPHAPRPQPFPYTAPPCHVLLANAEVGLKRGVRFDRPPLHLVLPSVLAADEEGGDYDRMPGPQYYNRSYKRECSSEAAEGGSGEAPAAVYDPDVNGVGGTHYYGTYLSRISTQSLISIILPDCLLPGAVGSTARRSGHTAINSLQQDSTKETAPPRGTDLAALPDMNRRLRHLDIASNAPSALGRRYLCRELVFAKYLHEVDFTALNLTDQDLADLAAAVEGGAAGMHGALGNTPAHQHGGLVRLQLASTGGDSDTNAAADCEAEKSGNDSLTSPNQMFFNLNTAYTNTCGLLNVEWYNNPRIQPVTEERLYAATQASLAAEFRRQGVNTQYWYPLIMNYEEGATYAAAMASRSEGSTDDWVHHRRSPLPFSPLWAIPIGLAAIAAALLYARRGKQ